VPGYLDRYLAKAGFEGQVTREPETDPDGNLFEASALGHAARGRFTNEAKPAPPAFDPSLIRGAIVLAGLVIAALLITL
jgi:hypothetical protein